MDTKSYNRVVVTGGAGQLGRYVVAELAQDYDVTVLDPVPDDTAPHQVLASVLDLGAVASALKGQDAVIHLAGIDAAVEASPQVVFETNVLGTWNVLHAAEEAGIEKSVVCSSVAASGFSVETPIVIPEYLPVDEAHPLRPCGTYGLSKLLGEHIAHSIVRRGRMHILCLRPALVAFPTLIKEVDKRAETADRGGAAGMQGRDAASGLSILRAYVKPEDCARCFRYALEADVGAFDSFYVTADDTFSRAPTLEVLQRQFGTLPAIRDSERFARNPRATAFDNTRVKEILGWYPQGSWADLVASCEGLS
ncbi:MAG: NAD(P)-dependent oxidoreductase [Gammaproteobacteria bacterium]|nr:NAD(P)-dependent oxidoreductase [Gammaproteobacteria bacterium]